MLAYPVGMADPAAALTEGARLALKGEHPLHDALAVSVLLTAAEIHELVGPPDRRDHRTGDAAVCPGLTPHLTYQTLNQGLVVRSRLTESPPCQYSLPGGSGGKEQDQPADAIAGVYRSGQESLSQADELLLMATGTTSWLGWNRCRAGDLGS